MGEKKIKLGSPSFGRKGKDAKGPKEPFSLRSAFLTSLSLMLCLWWLPIFGQMVSGYVGGRKSGSLLRGIAVSASSAGIFVALAFTITWIGFDLLGTGETFAASMFEGSPAVSELTISTFGYLQSLFESFGSTISAGIVILAITTVFGAVGGIISGQIRTEMEYRSPSAAPITSRAVDTHRSCKTGFGSFDDYLPVHAVQVNVEASKPLIRKASAREIPEPAAEEVRESPLSSILQMSDRNAQPRERPVSVQKDDFEYI